MSEQLDGGVGADAPFRGIKLQMSDEARASLMAVRAAQEVARMRARRETVRTRAWCGAIVGAIVVGIILLGPHVGRRGPASVSVAAAESATAPAAEVPSPSPPIAPPLGASSAGPLAPPATEMVASAGVAVATRQDQDKISVVATTDDCNATFGQRRWRMAAETCARAFEARPSDGALALTVAHAHHARGRFAEAGEWARRAIALDPRLAEAFAILAHAETRAGNAPAAAEAYRRYLALAPRGWHALEARNALRIHHQGDHARGPQRSETPTAGADRG